MEKEEGEVKRGGLSGAVEVRVRALVRQVFTKARVIVRVRVSKRERGNEVRVKSLRIKRASWLILVAQMTSKRRALTNKTHRERERELATNEKE